MKKRFLTLLFSLLCVICLSVNVSADSQDYLLGDLNLSEEAYDTLNQKAEEISNKYGINVTCLVYDGTSGSSASEYSEDVFYETFGDTDGIMLTYDYGNNQWYLFKNGLAEILDESDEDNLWDEFADYPDDEQAVEAYLNSADDILGLYYEGNDSDVSSDEVTDSKTSIPSEALLPRVVDDAGVLSEDEYTELTAMLDEISERQSFDVVVATVNSTGGQDIMDFADDFFDYNGYGFGEDGDGIVLMIDMGARNWWISTKGYGITAMTDAGLQFIKDQFLDDLSDGDYYDAFSTFATWCDKFVTEAREGKPYDEGHLPFRFLSPFWIFGALVIGFIPAIIVAFVKRSKLKSVHKEEFASAYMRPDSLNLTYDQDRFIDSIVTHRVISRDDDDGGGGSSTHTSSSGSEHGGTGGSF